MVSLVSSRSTHGRHLRGLKAASIDSIEDDDEERAATIAGGLIRDKAATKQWLYKLLDEGKSVDDVKNLLGMKGLILDGMLQHRNWSAIDRFARLYTEKITGVIAPYAKLGSVSLTKESTHKVLARLDLQHRSVEDVSNFLGLSRLSKSQQLLHPNWRAFKAYQKMFAQTELRDQTRYAFYGGFYRGIDEMKETLTKWAMAGHPIPDIAKTFRVEKLSGPKFMKHVNYRPFLAYVDEFNGIAKIRAAQVAKAGAANARTA